MLIQKHKLTVKISHFTYITDLFYFVLRYRPKIQLHYVTHTYSSLSDRVTLIYNVDQIVYKPFQLLIQSVLLSHYLSPKNALDCGDIILFHHVMTLVLGAFVNYVSAFKCKVLKHPLLAQQQNIISIDLNNERNKNHKFLQKHRKPY